MTSGCLPIPAYMDAESYPREYPFFLSMGGLSGPPANTTSGCNPASSLPEGMPDLDGGLSHTWSLVPFPQVYAESGILVDRGAHSDVRAGLHPSLYSTIPAIDTAAETSYPEIFVAASDIHNGDLPPVCHSEMGTVCQATISSCIPLNSTLLGSQSSASANSNGDPRGNNFAEAYTNRNRPQGGMSTNTPLEHSDSLLYTEIHTASASDVSALPVGVPDNYCLPIVVQDQERGSTETPWRSPNLGKGPTAASSRSRSKPVKPPRCPICKKDFKQTQGVARHIRDVHEVWFCPRCGFEWHRSHQLRKHLEEQHPDVHLDAALTETKNYRRWDTIIKNRPQGQQAFRLAVEYDRRSLGEHLPQQLTPPFPPALEFTHASSPTVSSVASSYDPPPEPMMPTIVNVTHRHEFEPARELELFDAAYSHDFFPTEERASAPPPNAFNFV